ncbi:hypothetical protein DL93DRAFT_940240 [Clavulina sp. PMI_390]|nr:hypothetical protein DL93DRAFT_940240 [Clavulina sp. PMI_390]
MKVDFVAVGASVMGLLGMAALVSCVSLGRTCCFALGRAVSCWYRYFLHVTLDGVVAILFAHELPLAPPLLIDLTDRCTLCARVEISRQS